MVRSPDFQRFYPDNSTEWFPLSSKNKYAGEVYLELTFWSNVRHSEGVTIAG